MHKKPRKLCKFSNFHLTDKSKAKVYFRSTIFTISMNLKPLKNNVNGAGGREERGKKSTWPPAPPDAHE